MAEGREGEDEAVDFGGGDGHGQAGVGGGRGRARDVHDAAGDVAVQVEVRGGVAGVGADLADHGEEDGEGRVGGGEGDVQDAGGVDEVVDGFDVVCSWWGWLVWWFIFFIFFVGARVMLGRTDSLERECKGKTMMVKIEAGGDSITGKRPGESSLPRPVLDVPLSLCRLNFAYGV